MQAWFDFYAVIGAAAATLTGLLFVALSMNAAVALSRGPEGSRRLAEQAFENYLAVLMVSLLALFPDMTPITFGRTALAVTATWTVWVGVRLYQAAAEPSVHESRFTAIRHSRHPGRRCHCPALLRHGEGLGPPQPDRPGQTGRLTALCSVFWFAQPICAPKMLAALSPAAYIAHPHGRRDEAEAA
jgi:hypothetical protein